MARKSLGFTRTEWTCPNCDTVNPGPKRLCVNCGMPQPDNVKFQQSLEEDLITDTAELEAAQQGPDVQCAFCDTRNPAGASNCSQCGAPLSEGKSRTSGEVLGAHRDEDAPPLICSACQAENEPTADKCHNCGNTLAAAKEAILEADKTDEPEPTKPEPKKKTNPLVPIFLAVGAILFLLCGCAFFVLANMTEDVTARVESVSWERSIEIEALTEVERQDWEDEIPSGAQVGQCSERVRYTTGSPPSNASYDEVCGTPYSVDQGNGFAEVVQDCEYQVYDDYCSYLAEEWRTNRTETVSGNDYAPYWPRLSLGPEEREGDRNETYRIIFDRDGEDITYTTSQESLYQQMEINSRWILSINTFGSVTDLRRE